MVLANPSMTTGLEQIRRSFEEAGGVTLAADAIQGFKKTHNID